MASNSAGNMVVRVMLASCVARGRSSPVEFGASECDREASIMRRP